MSQQIRIERKVTSSASQQARKDANSALDQRSPSGNKVHKN